MTDRALLEKAAKAAGLDFNHQWYSADSGILVWDAATGEFESKDWNPLTDDGDALRLAVKLGIQIRQYPIYDTPRFAAYACEAKWDSDAQRAAGSDALVNYDGDPYAATRRAIVRAAAAIGEQA